jgi:hypothetical protein
MSLVAAGLDWLTAPAATTLFFNTKPKFALKRALEKY